MLIAIVHSRIDGSWGRRPMMMTSKASTAIVIAMVTIQTVGEMCTAPSSGLSAPEVSYQLSPAELPGRTSGP
ncbi:MAG: hypothetical protein R2719_14875 [Micropruina sp.]